MTLDISRVVRQAARIGAGCLAILGGCAQQPFHSLPDEPNSVATCAAETAASVGLSVSALPIKIPAELAAKGPLETRGTLARRLVITFAPGSFTHGESLLWSRLAVRTLGGTVERWTRLQSDALLIEAAAVDPPRPGTKRRAARELAAIEAGAGYINVTRSAAYGTNIANTLSIDLLILPGGVPIDESIVRIPELWSSDGRPLAADAVRVELEPVRHVPGYDTVDADVALEYVLWRGRAGPACRSSAKQRTTLVDKEAVRPPLWDLGASSMNAPRTRWLGFSTPASGVLRPFVPVDRGAPETFHVLTSQEIQALRTGPLGEP